MKMAKYLILIVSLVAMALPGYSFADELDELCKKQLCRKPFTVLLKKKDGTHFKMVFDRALPIVSNEWITLYPGEKLYIEADRLDQALGKFRAVETNSHPDKTLVFQFRQDEGKSDMHLKVHNPFDQTIKYHAVLRTTDSDQMYKTSSCPVIPKGLSFEHWQHEIFQLMLFDFRFLSEKSGGECQF